MDKILEGLVSSSHPLPLKRVIVQRVVESAEHWLDGAQCEALFDLSTRLILEGQDPFQRQVGRQVLDAYARYHRPEFESFFSKTFVLGLLQRGYHSLDRKDVAILDYIHSGLKLIMSCPSVLDLFGLLQAEVLRMVCERPEPPLCARLCDLLGDFAQCVPKDKLAVAFCQQLVRTIGHFQCASGQEKELREYVSQVSRVSALLQNIWKAEPATLLPSLQEVFASISATGKGVPRTPCPALPGLTPHARSPGVTDSCLLPPSAHGGRGEPGKLAIPFLPPGEEPLRKLHPQPHPGPEMLRDPTLGARERDCTAVRHFCLRHRRTVV